jgi:S2P endopeptidase
MATLSLYIFNLLPLPLLDGSHFLRTLLQMAEDHDNSMTTNEYDLEALDLPREQLTSPRGHWWSNQLAGVVPKVTMGLFGGCVMLEIMNTVF